MVGLMHLEETSAIIVESVGLGPCAQSLVGNTGFVRVFSVKPKGAKLETRLYV